MKYKALLFGSIGTLIESSDIQRNSFNEAFKEAGLDWYWDEQDYKILLKKTGGTKRVEDFADVNSSSVSNGQVLRYISANDTFITTDRNDVDGGSF